MGRVNVRAKIDEYANRVLGVVKEKYGLKDKSEALNRFVSMYGEEFVEKEVKEEFVAEAIAIVKEHHSKYPDRKMSLDELDRLVENR